MLPNRLLPERIGGDYAAMKSAVGSGKPTAVFYATQNARYWLAAATGKFFLYVTADRMAARSAKEILESYCGREVALVPERDDVLYNVKVNTSATVAERTSALAAILTGKVAGAVVSAEGVLQRYPSRSLFLKALTLLKKGAYIPPEELAERLVSGGYRPSEQVLKEGDFARRGDVFDIWNAGAELPVRLEFFGDEIESIRLFAPESMLSVRETDEVTVAPVSDILVSREVADSALKRLFALKKKAFRELSDNIDSVAERLEADPGDPSLVWALPFVKECTDDIVSYLPEDAVVVLDEPRAIDEKLKLYRNAHTVRVKSLAESGAVTAEHAGSIYTAEEAVALFGARTILGFQQITSSNPVFEPKAIFSLKSLPLTRYSSNYEALAADVKNLCIGGSHTMIYAGNEGTAETLAEFFREHDIGVRITADTEDEYPVVIIPERLARGFVCPAAKLALIGTDDVVRRSGAPRKSAARKRQAFVMPEKGDYVVHERHGIGMSEGLVTLTTSLGTKDYYCILYRGGDRLYLPTDRLDEVDKYTGGGTPQLNKLGSKEFERVKERVRGSVKKMATDLVALYEKRLRAKGYKYAPDTVWQKELEDNFPYDETDDQLIAIAEIKEDMEKGKVMDRLLCGDVGFGKTEVAVRAIFKTIIEGKQAAFLSPTTILAQQHYNTLSERFAPFGIKIDLLSRLVSREGIKSALERIKSGETSVIVATHRLLGKDVVFKDLGLLVLDEEQRFGVEHKEKIKVLKNNVNVLSMSATPIPRTLHMALSGIRDISTLETPPESRLPVETYVVECSDALIKDACTRELARGGQVFILFNRVQGIEKFHREISDLLGDEARVIYAHGQMDDALLEERIRAFYNKEADVLIATTIIENGIDIPDANTLIVIDADRLGLGELYQLRGRVGRSHNLAYAYFTVREGKVLTENAGKRLDALMRYTELGSGFKIAMQDLEIRGAGNVLGREQHGNMEKVGYDLYCKILRECVGEMRGEKINVLREVEIVVEGDTALPADYIPEGSGRVAFYKRISSLGGQKEYEECVREVRDVYGPLPQAAENLVKVGLIKNLARKLDIKKVTVAERGYGIVFYEDASLKNAGLLAALDKFRSDAVLIPSSPVQVIFSPKIHGASARLDFVTEFLAAAEEAGKKSDTDPFGC